MARRLPHIGGAEFQDNGHDQLFLVVEVAIKQPFQTNQFIAKNSGGIVHFARIIAPLQHVIRRLDERIQMPVDGMVILVQNIKSDLDPFVLGRQFGEIIGVLNRVMFM